MSLFKSKKPKEEKKLHNYDMLEPVSCDLDAVSGNPQSDEMDYSELIFETDKYEIFIYHTIEDKYSKNLIRRDKQNHADNRFLGTKLDRICLFENHLFQCKTSMLFHSGLVSPHYLYATDIETGETTTFNWLSQGYCHFTVNGHSNSTTQDHVLEMYVKNDKLVLEVSRTKADFGEAALNDKYNMNGHYTLTISYEEGRFNGQLLFTPSPVSSPSPDTVGKSTIRTPPPYMTIEEKNYLDKMLYTVRKQIPAKDVYDKPIFKYGREHQKLVLKSLCKLYGIPLLSIKEQEIISMLKAYGYVYVYLKYDQPASTLYSKLDGCGDIIRKNKDDTIAYCLCNLRNALFEYDPDNITNYSAFKKEKRLFASRILDQTKANKIVENPEQKKKQDDLTNNPQSVKKTEMTLEKVNEQLEILKKLKELYDSGVLSEEEFQNKKREILRLE